ncbi:MAG TPA: 1-phosphofructokinase family hexose kinase [Roseiflexaceae bacterium]|nr:1-phosphofructokinase family hexose kinase [Roseiflexaceae bacterium]
MNANAAIDKTVVVGQFGLNAIHRPQQVMAVAGGKGANVARALQRLGETPVVAGWVGGYSGQFIAAGLRGEGIATAFVETGSESRTCLSILDPEQNTLTEIYERGEPVSETHVAEFRDLFRAIVGQYAAVTLSGSLPPGVPDDFYAELIAIARTAQVPTLLDSSGTALKHGLERGRPLLIKPNATEFAALAGVELNAVEAIAGAAARLAREYATIVVVSLGADGALAASATETLLARPPELPIASAVGSGDSTLAGLAYALVRDWPLADAVRYGVAAGTANALTIGGGQFSTDDFTSVHAQVDVETCAC